MKSVVEKTWLAHHSLLLTENQAPACDLACLLEDNPEWWTDRLSEHGAILFRGFAVGSVPAFERVVKALAKDRLDYVYGSTPRHAVGDRVFTTTEYPPSQEIPLHNENSYQREWPLKVAFCGLQPAVAGGETPLADLQHVDEAIGREILDAFEARQVRYVRHYLPAVDVPWQQVFRTDDRAVLAAFCAQHAIEHEWLDNETLRTVQVCQGTAKHPASGALVFFNQAHLFHASSLGGSMEQSMAQLFGADRLPRQAYFGDGEQIPTSWLEHIRAAYTQSSFAFAWLAGDVLLLDNMRYAHGRRAFKGTRRVVAALMDRHCGYN